MASGFGRPNPLNAKGSVGHGLMREQVPDAYAGVPGDLTTTVSLITLSLPRVVTPDV